MWYHSRAVLEASEQDKAWRAAAFRTPTWLYNGSSSPEIRSKFGVCRHMVIPPLHSGQGISPALTPNLCGGSLGNRHYVGRAFLDNEPRTASTQHVTASKGAGTGHLLSCYDCFEVVHDFVCYFLIVVLGFVIVQSRWTAERARVPGGSKRAYPCHKPQPPSRVACGRTCINLQQRLGSHYCPSMLGSPKRRPGRAYRSSERASTT